MKASHTPGWIAALLGWLVAGLAWTAVDPGRRADELRAAEVPAASGRVPIAAVPRIRPAELEAASARELRALPGLGEVRALAVARARWENGGRPPLELEDVRGVGSRTADRVRSAVGRPAVGASVLPPLPRIGRARGRDRTLAATTRDPTPDPPTGRR